MNRLKGWLAVYFGLILFAHGLTLVWQRQRPLPVYASSQLAEAEVTKEPTNLVIPSLSLNLPIRSSRIVDNKWSTVTDGVSYLNSSPLPGEKGNSVLYGHNWPNLLSNLKHIKPGDKIEVYFGSRVVKYQVHYITRVSPSEFGIYGDTSDYRLTIYTCIGLFDQERLVVTAFLIT